MCIATPVNDNFSSSVKKLKRKFLFPEARFRREVGDHCENMM